MRKFLTSTLAAATFGAAVAATAAPAQARDYYDASGYRHHRSSGDKAAVAAFAGIAGLALGAALSSSNGGSRGYSSYSSGYSSRGGYAYDPRYDSYSGGYGRGGYDRGDYARGGYDRGYDNRGYYAQPDRVCISRERVWDPYIERNVTIERRYPC